MRTCSPRPVVWHNCHTQYLQQIVSFSAWVITGFVYTCTTCRIYKTKPEPAEPAEPTQAEYILLSGPATGLHSPSTARQLRRLLLLHSAPPAGRRAHQSRSDAGMGGRGGGGRGRRRFQTVSCHRRFDCWIGPPIPPPPPNKKKPQQHQTKLLHSVPPGVYIMGGVRYV